MKSKLKKIGMIALFFMGLASADASAQCTGKWISVYGGNHYAANSRCVEHWWSSDCICGDVKANYL